MDQMTRRQKRELAQMRSDMEGMLAHPFSRRFLMRLIHNTGVYSTNTEVSGVREGMRRVGLGLVNDIMTVDPTAYAKLMLEAATMSAKTNTDTDQPTGDEADENE